MESSTNSQGQNSNHSSLGRTTEEFIEKIKGKFLNSEKKPIEKIHLLRRICLYIKKELDKERPLDENRTKTYEMIKTATLRNNLLSNNMKDIFLKEIDMIKKFNIMEHEELLDSLDLLCICRKKNCDNSQQCLDNIEKLLEFIGNLVDMLPGEYALA